MPAAAKYGAQTQRAVENFPISGIPIDRRLIRSLAVIKGAAAQVNASLRDVGVDRRVATAISAAAEEVAEGVWDSEFPVDVFQTGSGTSSNMNANEVIATLASERLGEPGVGAPERPRQRLAELQRRVPVGRAPGRRGVGRAGAGAGGRAPPLRLRPQGPRVPVGREVGSHPPHGRHAGHPRPGDGWLRRAARRRGRAPRAHAAPGRSAAPRGHGRGHGHQRAADVRAPGHRPAGRAHRPAPERGPRPLRRPGCARRPGRGVGGAAGRWRWR